MSRFPVSGNSHEQKSMEWYWGSDDVDDLVVPRDQERSFERISSPISWTQWGATASVVCSYFKNSFNGVNVGDRQDLDLNGRNYNGVMNMNMNYSVQKREHQDYDYDYDSSPMCPGGQYNGSLQWPHDEDQAKTDRMGDIFLYNKSLLEEDGTGEDNPSGNTFNDDILEQQYILSNSQSSGSSKYLKTHSFSPSMDWENAKDSLNDFTGEESYLEASVLYLEASVLQDLEWVISLFTDKTRICWRDALFRLAENSKQPSHMGQDGDIIVENHPMLTKDDENPRTTEEIEVKEMKTNAIDRAVACLMFSGMNFNDEDQSNFSLYQHTVSYCPPLARLAEDVEVAIVPC